MTMTEGGAMTKLCRRCGETKPAGEFYRRKQSSDGLSSFCRKCHTAATVTWQNANRDRVRQGQKKRRQRNRDRINAQSRADYTPEKGRAVALARYRLTPAEYDGLSTSQDDRCALCGGTNPVRPLVVDHDHSCCPKTPTCGTCNRGLLCSPCNQAIAAMDRDPQWIVRARLYLGKAQLARTRALLEEVG